MVSREMHVVRLSLDPEAEKRYSAMDSWESDHGTLGRRF
jgi:hypothetical protein